VLEACGKAAAQRIQRFRALIDQLGTLAASQDAARVLRRVLEATGYVDWLYADDPETADDRAENVQELLNAAQTFVAESDEGRLADFLESVALLADVDRMEESGDLVTLMTMHTAKGLEYPIVFVAGCEEGLLPHANAADEADGVEEERRLFYVALTRARLRVHLLAASLRRRFGAGEPALPSRFLEELPGDCVIERGERRVESSAPAWGDGRRGAGLFDEPKPPRRRRPPAPPEKGGAWKDAFGVETFRRSQARRRTAAAHGFEDHELSQEEHAYAVGQRVRHQSLGEGEIVAVEGFGELTKLTIDFGEAGRKRILARYAHLEPIDGETPF
jgi:DNA helicase-2/ATP-dependent DNA helicase PcrA